MWSQKHVVLNAATAIVGIAVVIPAFVLFIHLAFLGNVARTAESGAAPLTSWLGIITLFGGIAYLIAFGKLLWIGQAECKWCLYGSIGYAAYVAAMMWYISMGDFADQIKTSGLVPTLSNHVSELLYVIAPLALIALLLFRKRQQVRTV